MLNFDRSTVKHGTPNSGFLTAFVFGRGSARDPAGEVTALPTSPSWFKEAYF